TASWAMMLPARLGPTSIASANGGYPMRHFDTGCLKLIWRRASFAAALLSITGAAAPARAQTEADLLLVFAVDASGSVNQYRFELQKRGYVAALRNPRV